jgi:soluble lytic murein transglycosylase
MSQTNGRRKKLQNALLLTFIIWAAAMVARAAPTDQTLRDAIAGAGDSAFDQPDTLALLRYGLPPRPRIKPGQASKPAGVLSADNADIYRKIFALQGAGEWKQADALMGKLTDSRLTGHVLFQRYTQPGAPRASYDDLADWLDRYAELPGADRIYKMAQARKPRGLATAALRHPVRSGGINGYLDVFSDNSDGYVPHLPRTAAQKHLISRLDGRIRDALAEGAPSRAYGALSGDPAAKLLDSVEYDQMRAQIAGSFFYLGKADKALELASASAARSGNKAPLAGWTGGLAAWRQKDFKKAAGLFELAGTSPYASDWMAAGGAYWAARAHIRAGEISAAGPWLNRAAGHPHAFYGLIAARALGRDMNFNWDIPALTPAMIHRLESIPAGQRAIALVAAGQIHMAEEELFKISPGNDKQLTQALLAYANQAGLPALAMRLAEAVPHPGGGLYDAALYPLSPWTPHNGYKVDRALIDAIVRQESRFNPWAESRSGASGLMQLMPQTARDIAGSRASLHDPETNLDIGQHYVSTLLDQQPVSTDLFSLVIAYNAGPGNLRRWKDGMEGMNDPLLFLESIPVAETRAFAEKVMTNYWIYRLRLKQPVPSLDAVAGGQWAQYVSIDSAEERADAGPKPALLAAN